MNNNERYYLRGGRLFFRTDGGEYVINYDRPIGNVFPYRYDNRYWIAKSGTNVALLDDAGEFIIPFSYECERVEDVSEGIAIMRKMVAVNRVEWIGGFYYALEPVQRYGAFNIETREWIINPESSNFTLMHGFRYGFCNVRTEDEREGFINKSGELVKTGYLATHPFTEAGRAVFVNEKRQIGFVDTELKERILKGTYGFFGATNFHAMNFHAMNFHVANGKILSSAILVDDKDDETWVIIDENEKIIHRAETGKFLGFDDEKKAFFELSSDYQNDGAEEKYLEF